MGFVPFNDGPNQGLIFFSIWTSATAPSNVTLARNRLLRASNNS